MKLGVLGLGISESFSRSSFSLAMHSLRCLIRFLVYFLRRLRSFHLCHWSTKGVTSGVWIILRSVGIVRLGDQGLNSFQCSSSDSNGGQLWAEFDTSYMHRLKIRALIFDFC